MGLTLSGAQAHLAKNMPTSEAMLPIWRDSHLASITMEITLIQMMAEEHKVTTSMVIQVIQNEVSVQPNF